MADKNLKMTFLTAGGDETEMTVSGGKQDLDESAVKTAMQSMCDSMAFANGDGDLYDQPLKAVYVETIETPIFDTTEETV